MTSVEPSPLRAEPQPVSRIGKAERTRAAILDAALAFLWTRPFREMTITELMESTGVSRAAFYQYFAGLHEVMQTLQVMLLGEIFSAVEPWLARTGDPVALLNETMAGLARVCHERGPFIRAMSDAATTDEIYEASWRRFMREFDDAVSARIEADQEQGLIPGFDARTVAFALNRLDASTLIEAFGQHPRMDPEPVRATLTRIWMSTLYGIEWVGRDSSQLVRN